ncbi:transcription-repair coupling factor [Flavobacteriaceae bacterium]|nr:transcription-repair coupling factor [Flavobacteriaceae bacterium]
MEIIKKQLQILQPDLQIAPFPAWDCFPYDKISPKNSISSNRIQTAHLLTQKISNKTLVLATINSALQKTIPKEIIRKVGFEIKKGDSLNITKLSEILLLNGYNRDSLANNIGDFAKRGDIVDFVLNDPKQPDNIIGYRINFFGDKVENIRIFDPITQITYDDISYISIIPVNEIIFSDQNITTFKKKYQQNFGVPNSDLMHESIIQKRFSNGMEHWMPMFYEEPCSSLMEYCSDAIFSIEDDCRIPIKERTNLVTEYYETRIEERNHAASCGNVYQPLPPSQLYLNTEEFWEEIKNHKKYLINFNIFQSDKAERIMDFNFKEIPNFSAKSESIFDNLKNFLADHYQKKIIICYNSTYSKQRIERIFQEYKIPFQTIQKIDDRLKKSQIGLLNLPLNEGFYYDDLALISENRIFGDKSFKKPRKKAKISDNQSLQIGELVVHHYYGIGRFEGIKNISSQTITNDFLELSFAEDDKLFVPVEDIGLVTRYGEHNPFIKLDKLGLSAWKNRQAKIKKRIKVSAAELIKVAALRQMQQSPILTPDKPLYEQFKDQFEFAETEDQLTAIEDVEEDLEAGSPMDRLICGDVGFGKTEVALRAVFIAVKNQLQPHQVAIIVPTTLLCRQHFAKFCQRFEKFGVNIKQISRMVTPSQKKQTKLDLATGKVDIVIGTHALLAKDIKFDNLGLIILDEEQHFGVAQKEKIKKLRDQQQVHLLSLSATPIPRTLQMSLSGVKDLSIIATPPIDRLAIRSFVTQYDRIMVRDAVMREFKRGGRVFFVVPKIKDIAMIENDLKKILPEIRMASAHGQMTPETLDDIMNDFYDGKFDMLLSTTIIESGIDISIANTIIIYKAEMFGLSQLYQIRGRVGRGKVRAYAYLMHTENKKLTETAKKRLKVMQDIDSLGVGFNIASHDMDIRGGGNILGDEQSGHIKETGVELYHDMLNDEIQKLKIDTDGKPSQESFDVKIKLGVSLFIAEDYISDFSVRMSLYKRIAEISDKDEKDLMLAELEDRFGEPAQEIKNLLEISYQKNLCKNCNVEILERKSDGIMISFKDNYFENSEKLIKMIGKSKDVKLVGQKLLFSCDMKKNILDNSLEVLKKLIELVNY